MPPTERRDRAGLAGPLAAAPGGGRERGRVRMIGIGAGLALSGRKD